MELERAIGKTIDYAKRYDGELTITQLKERLISDKTYGDEEIIKIARKLKIKNQNHNSKFKIIKMRKAEDLVKRHLGRFRDIVMVGVTGSVAAGYPKKNDDIDLLIVTRHKRLWLIRLMLRIYINRSRIPHRGWGEEEKRDQFCFNLWLEENSLKIPGKRRRLRAAMDLIMMKVILNREKTYEKMITANSWTKKYVATGYNKIRSKFKVPGSKIEKEDKNSGRVKNILNWLVFWLQYWYMKGKIRGEIVDINRAFFNQ